MDPRRGAGEVTLEELVHIQTSYSRTLGSHGLPLKIARVMTTSFLLFFLMFIYLLFLRERERESTRRGGAESEGDTESEAGSRVRAVSAEPDAGDRDLSRSQTLNRLSHAGAP